MLLQRFKVLNKVGRQTNGMATARNLTVIKRPRTDPIPDIPASFPPLQNLHLNLLEIKGKLKPGLPLIPLTQSKLNVKPKPSPTPASKPALVLPAGTSAQQPKTKAKPKTKNKNKNKDNADSSPPQSAPTAAPAPASVDAPRDAVLDDLAEDSEDELMSEDGDSSEDEFADATVPDDGAGEDGAGEDEPFDIYAGLTPEEREVKEKEEYVWRFRILAKQYGRDASIPIPEWNEHSDLTMMKTSYERTLRELYLDDAVEQYRTYLLGGWLVMEYVCTQIIKIDMRGFTAQQTKMMHKYDRMLIELGEKSYTRWGSTLPVEVRLLGLILFQAGIFYLGKMITENFGGSVAELFKGFTGQPPDAVKKGDSTTDDVTDNPPAKKMRGPSHKASDIRNRAA